MVFGHVVRQKIRVPILLSIAFSFTMPWVTAQAQSIKFDGSLGDADSNGANAISLTGPNYQIEKIDGQLEGSNLFHSFEAFGLINGESATFESTGVSNILTRVTGGAASSIDGGIVAGANIFFMNPNGVMFGPNSSLDVSGAFTATTADRIHLQGGGTFLATASELPATVTGDITSFGFMGPDAPIVLNGVNWGVSSADSIHLLGGSVQITDSTIAPASGRVNLVAVPSGATTTLSVLDPASIPVVDLPIPETASVTINGTTGSNVNSVAGGNVVIRGGRLVVDSESSISSADSETAKGGNINIQVTGQTIVNGAIQSTSSTTNGGGIVKIGSSINPTGSVTIGNGGRIESSTTAGKGGQIDVYATTDILLSGGSIASIAAVGSTEPGGDITLNAGGNITVQSIVNGIGATLPASIRSTTNGIGKGGTISIAAAKNIDVFGSELSPATISSHSTSSGNGGNITFLAGNSLTVGTQGWTSSHTTGTGTAGNIQLGTPNAPIPTLTISGGEVSVRSQGIGGVNGRIGIYGTNTIIEQSQILSLGGANSSGGEIRISGDEVLIGAGTTIDASGPSGGGAIYVGGGLRGEDSSIPNATNTIVEDGAVLRADALQSGDGGEVIVFAENRLDFLGSISARGGALSGDGGFAEVSGRTEVYVPNISGQVNLSSPFGTVGTLLIDPIDLTITNGAGGGINGTTITDGAILSALGASNLTISTSGAGSNPGNITLNGTADAGGAVDITWSNGNNLKFEADNNFTINVGAQIESTGGGSIEIDAANGTLENEGRIATSTSGTNASGLILVSAETLNLTGQGSRITTHTTNEGDAGDIVINAQTTRIRDGAGITSLSTGVTATNGDTGNITIRKLRSGASSFEINNSTFTAGSGVHTSASGGGAAPLLAHGTGNAGDIWIESDTISVTKGNIEADTNVYIADNDSRNGTSKGNAGKITLIAEGMLTVTDAEISTRSDGIESSNAGTISITAGNIIINEGAPIIADQRGDGTGVGGDIEIDATSLTVNSTFISTSTFGTGKAGSVQIELSEDLTLNGGNITSFAWPAHEDTASEDAGKVEVTARDITLTTLRLDQADERPATISTGTGGPGNAGSVLIQAQNLTVNEKSSVSSATEARRFDNQETKSGSGNAGSVTINAATSVNVRGIVETKTTGVGNGGAVTIRTPEVVISSTGAVRSNTTAPGTTPDTAGGPAGSVTINASTSVDLRGSIETETGGMGNGGVVTIMTPRMDINNNGAIRSNTFGAGSAGSVIINADLLNVGNESATSLGKIESSTFGSGTGGDVIVNSQITNLNNSGSWFAADAYGDNTGHAGEVNITATESLNLNNGAQIFSTTIGSGRAGEVNIQANSFTLAGQNSLVSTATTGSGNAGDIVVSTNNLRLNENTFIESNAFHDDNVAGLVTIDINNNVIPLEGNGTGNAGTIKIIGFNSNSPNMPIATSSAETVLVEFGGSISTGTREVGNAGTISVNSDEINVNGSITAQSSGSGNAGSITLNSESLNINGAVEAYTDNTGQGGNITITSDSIHLQNGRIAADAFGLTSKDAGDITITATDNLNISNGGQIFSTTVGQGDAGDIRIDAKNLILNGSNSLISTATIGSGKAGNVVVGVESLTLGNATAIESNAYVDPGVIQVLTQGVLDGLGLSGVGDGNAGTVQIKGYENLSAAQLVTIDGEIGTGTRGIGKAGDISVSAANLSINPAGKIQSQSSNSATGTAGNINVNAGIGLVQGSIDSRSDGTGNAGTVAFTGGQLTIANNGFVTSQTTGSGNAGQVSVIGDQVIFCGNAFATSQTSGTGRAGTVTLRANDLTLKDGAFLTTLTSSGGNAGTIALEIENLTLAGTSSITSTTSSSGDAGSLKLNLNRLTLLDGGSVSATSSGSGKGGNVDINANEIIVDGGVIEAQATSNGAAGSIDLMAAIVVVRNGGRISATTTGSGQGGSVTINTTGHISVSGSGRIEAETRGSGNAGSVNLATNNLFLASEGSVSATTFGSGDSGNITVAARDRVQIQGNAAIEAISQGSGNAGNITLNANQVSMKNGGNISATTLQTGLGGNIQIGASQIELSANGSGIFAQTAGSGRAGNIEVAATNDLNLLKGASISGTTSSSGRAGDITARAYDVNIDGSGSGIFAESTGSGNAGSIDVNVTGANTLRLSNNGTISSRSSGSGNAGSIDIDSAGLIVLNSGSSINVESLLTNAGSIFLDGGSNLLVDSSSITARAGQNAGNIEIRVPDTIRLDNSAIIAEAGRDGGNIIIDDARFLLLNNSILSANAILGTGGFIQIGSDVLFQNNSDITASSEFGTDGEVRIDALSDLSAAQAALDAALLDSNNDLQERCTIKLPGQRNSFILVGRGGLPVMPGRFLPGHQLLELPESQSEESP